MSIGLALQETLRRAVAPPFDRRKAAALRSIIEGGATYSQIAASDLEVPERLWILARLALQLPDGHRALVRWAVSQIRPVLDALGSHRDLGQNALDQAEVWSRRGVTAEECLAAANAVPAFLGPRHFCVAYVAVAASYRNDAAEATADTVARACAVAIDSGFIDRDQCFAALVRTLKELEERRP